MSVSPRLSAGDDAADHLLDALGLDGRLFSEICTERSSFSRSNGVARPTVDDGQLSAGAPARRS
jgi:hypothetical protein